MSSDNLFGSESPEHTNESRMSSDNLFGSESPEHTLADSQLEPLYPEISFYAQSSELSLNDKLSFDEHKELTELTPISAEHNQLLPSMEHNKVLPGIDDFFSHVTRNRSPHSNHSNYNTHINHNTHSNHSNSSACYESGMSSPTSSYDSKLPSPVNSPEPRGATATVVQNWNQKHPSKWDSNDVLDWVMEVAQAERIDGEISEAFQEYTGQKLMEITAKGPDGFVPLSSKHCAKFYVMFNQLKKRSEFIPPEEPMFSPKYSDFNTECTFDIGSHKYTVDVSESFPGLFLPHLRPSSDDGYSSGGSERNNVITHTNTFQHPSQQPHQQQQQQQHQQQQHQQHQQQQQLQQPQHQHHIQPHQPTQQQLASHQGQTYSPSIPMSVIEPETDDVNEDDDDAMDDDQDEYTMTDTSKPSNGCLATGKRRRGRKPGQTTRGNHLWEFVRDLLKDARYCPSLIKWENRDLGVFRFVQSAQVAKMWGRRKNNQTMNYEKLSRAMRFCRDKDYFAALPTEGKYPKKLCFRFGERAHGWKSDD